MIDSIPLIFPSLGGLYQVLAPWAEALMRAVVGLALVWPAGITTEQKAAALALLEDRKIVARVGV